MHTIVVYGSHYGHTSRYAQWLAESLGCRAVPARSASGADLNGCDTVIFGGGLYAGGVAGARFLAAHAGELAEKRLAVFTCGLADPENPENAASLHAAAEKALPPVLRERAAVFHLRGGIHYARLRPVHRAMMAALCAVLRHRPPEQLRAEDRELLATYGQQVHFLDRASLEPILAWARDSSGATAPSPSAE